jgi:PKD domain
VRLYADRMVKLALVLSALVWLALAMPASASFTTVVDLSDEGVIIDATPETILWHPPDAGPLTVRDPATDPTADVELPMPPGRELGYNAVLFDEGVLFTTHTAGTQLDPQLHEWRADDPTAVTSLGAIDSESSLEVAGNYAIWTSRDPARPLNDPRWTLTRRDLAAETNAQVAPAVGNTDNDVAPDGDVVYWTYPDYDVKKWDGATTTQLSDATDGRWATYPLTDGTLTVFRRGDSSGGALSFNDGTAGTETELPGSGVADALLLGRGRDYQVRGGWIAYTQAAGTQIWSRPPGGVPAKVTPQTGPDPLTSAIGGLAPNGQVAWVRSFVTEGYLGVAGKNPFPLGGPGTPGAAGTPFWQGNRWYFISDDALFRLETDTAIVDGPDPITNETTAHFELAATGVEPDYECTLDGAAVDCDGEGYTTGTLSEGVHTFMATSTDPAIAGAEGTDETPATEAWTVDSIAPSPFNVIDPKPGGWTNNAFFRWEGASDSGSGVASYEISLDGTMLGTVDSAARTFDWPGDVADGQHTVVVRALDGAGNAREATSTYGQDRQEPTDPTWVSPADEEVVSTARPTLTWTASTDERSGLAAYLVKLDGKTVRVSAEATSFTPDFDLPDGSHRWRVLAEDNAANRTPDSDGPWAVRRAFRVDTRPPAAAIVADPNPTLEDQAVRFDASGTVPAAAPRVRFEWDLDGDGTYETDTSDTATVERTYANPQELDVGVRVTDGAGRSGTATTRLKVTPAPLPGPPGVSINDGAAYTQDRDVTVTLRWPMFATEMLVSNDGGFGGAEPRPLAPTLDWRLATTGPDRLPKTVYVRYLGGLAGNETYTDDIVLDETAPRILAATVEQLGGGATAARTKTRYRIRMKVRELASGPAKVRLAARRDKPGRLRRYQRSFRVSATRKPRWVRVYDRAGNRSRWRRLETKR